MCLLASLCAIALFALECSARDLWSFGGSGRSFRRSNETEHVQGVWSDGPNAAIPRSLLVPLVIRCGHTKVHRKMAMWAMWRTLFCASTLAGRPTTRTV